MLYITTRNSIDSYTSQYTLGNDFAPDGAAFVPNELPTFRDQELLLLLENSFGTNFANILNKFFSCKLSGWDVEFCVGRNIYRLISMNHRVVITELWHNLGDEFPYIVRQLYAKISNVDSQKKIPSYWFRVVCLISVLFAIYGELLKCKHLHLSQTFDISLAEDDFVSVLAAWYARKIGLPINMIVCTCKENSTLWDFVHRGVFIPTFANTYIRSGIEQLIYATLGQQEIQNYIEKCNANQVYALSEEMFENFDLGLFCTVPGPSRAASVINSVYRSNSYLLDPGCALCYGSIQDYRARCGASHLALIIAQEIPTQFSLEITSAAGVSKDTLMQQIKQA